MSKWEKLLDKITTLSKEVRFNELKEIIESEDTDYENN